MTGDLVIRDGRIIALGPGARARARRRHVTLNAIGDIVMPGLIQTHVHLCQTLMRGMAEDLPLLEWLQRRVWPLEAAHDERSLRASAELGLAEMLLAGTTTILDMGTTHGHDIVLDACERFGIRTFSGKAMMDRGRGVPTRLRESTAASLAESERLRTHWDGAADGRIRYAYAPRFILSCSEKLLRATVDRAQQAGCLVHIHASEHRAERDAVRAVHGADDVDVLATWGVRGPGAVLVHAVQLTARQVRAVAREGTRVVHCPSANMKLGSGLAPVAALLQAGAVLGIGADGAACNNNLDPWQEIRLAALLGKLRDGPSALCARDALALATSKGAQLLGIDHEIGSLELGKQADVIVVSLTSVRQAPMVRPIDTLVFSTGARDVRHVLVGGELLVQDGRLTGLDAAQVRASAFEQGPRLMRRAGLA